MISLSGHRVRGTLHFVPHVGTRDIGWRNAMVAVFDDEAITEGCILGMDLLGQQPIAIDWQAQRVLPLATGLAASLPAHD